MHTYSFSRLEKVTADLQSAKKRVEDLYPSMIFMFDPISYNAYKWLYQQACIYLYYFS